MTIRGNKYNLQQRSPLPDFSTGDPIAEEKARVNYGFESNHSPERTQDAMKIDLDRPVFHQQSFNEAYQLARPPSENAYETVKQYIKSSCNCTPEAVWKLTKKRLPFLEWLPKYDLKNNTVNDLIGGVTVGIMQIPQGMAYALLANLPPVVGLYVSFFSVLVYFFLGTSRHLSLGTFAVVSLMTGNVINQYINNHDLLGNDNKTETPASNDYSSSTLPSTISENGTLTTLYAGTTPASDDNSLDQFKIQLGAAIAFLVGVMQVGMSILQLGALSVYLSDTLVSGFTTGAACHVFTSQVKYILGISIKNYSGVIAIIYTYIDIFKNIQYTNLVTLALSACVIVVLVIVNDCINARFKSKMIMPVPMELLVIVATTLASYYLDLNGNYDVLIVGNIPTGIPPPRLPMFYTMGDLAVGSVAIAIVSYCIPISLAKIYAKKHRYDIDPNQELLAYGAGNVVGGFFSCFPSCGSLSRSSVQESSGAKTQIASLISSLLILIVLLFIAPLFECVPNCVLAGIIVVALRGMFRQVSDLKKAWKMSKTEAAIWLVTFLSVVLLDVDYGLLASLAFLLIMLLYKLQRPYSTVLGNVPTTDMYLDLQKYKVPKEVKGLKIIHFGGALYFANREYFRQQLYKLVFNPQKEMAKRKKEKKEKSKKDDTHSTISSQDLVDESKRDHENVLFSEDHNGAIITLSPNEIFEERDEPNALPLPGSPDTVAAVILDCSAMSFVDSAALSMLSQILTEYTELGVRLCLACCRDNVIVKLERSEFYKKLERNIFPTIHDAVLNIAQIQEETKIVEDPATHL